MPRPGFVLEVDERTPPLLVHEGEGYRMQKFPLGTRVVYPPDPLPGLKNLNAQIRRACSSRPATRSRCPSCCSPG